MKLKFSHTTQELVDLHVFNTWSAPWKKNNRQRMGYMIPLSFALFALAFIVNGTSIPLGILLIVIAVLWLLFYDKVFVKRISNFAKGYYNHEVNERFWAEYEYDFNDKFIGLKNEYVEAKIQWKSISNFIERDDVYWLFETLTSAHIIPKRIMSEQERNEFKRILSKHLVR